MPNITNYQGMQIKTTMRYYFIPVRMFSMKKIRDKCWQGHGEKEPLFTPGENVNWWSHKENSMEGPHEIKELPYDPVNLALKQLF